MLPSQAGEEGQRVLGGALFFGSAKVSLDPFAGSPENIFRMHLDFAEVLLPWLGDGHVGFLQGFGGTEAMSGSQKRGGRIYQASASPLAFSERVQSGAWWLEATRDLILGRREGRVAKPGLTRPKSSRTGRTEDSSDALHLPGLSMRAVVLGNTCFTTILGHWVLCGSGSIPLAACGCAAPWGSTSAASELEMLLRPPCLKQGRGGREGSGHHWTT